MESHKVGSKDGAAPGSGPLVGRPGAPGLRVCLEARIDPETNGGVAQFVIGLVSALSRLSNGNERYFVVTQDGRWIQRHASGPCEVVTVPRGNAATASRIKRMVKRLPVLAKAWSEWSHLLGPLGYRLARSDGTVERLEADLVHFTWQSGYLTRVPSLYHPHDLQHVHLPQYVTPRDRYIRDLVFRAFCDQAAMVPVASRWVREDVISTLGLSAAKVHVVPFAPLLGEYRAPTPEAVTEMRRRHGLPERYGLYPAQTWPHKNHERLLEAMARARAQGLEEIAFVFTGKMNAHAASLQRKARELGLESRARFLGFVEADELACLYAGAHGMVVPSKFEAGSFPLWEAFQSGVPAACSKVTSLPEQAGDAARLFDPDDVEGMAEAIRAIWTDAGLRATLVEKGRSRLKAFSWDRTARLFRAHYRRLANRGLTAEDAALLGEAAPF